MGLFKKKKFMEAAVGMVPAAQDGVGADSDTDNTVAGEGAAGAPGEELIAVIAAAVAAYEAEQYGRALFIRKLNRVAGTRPAWGVTGTMEAIDMRRM
jgi:hypothetical protein